MKRSLLRIIFILLIPVLLISGCGGILGRGEVGHQRTPSGKVGLVLGGGLARAYTAIGVLRVLEREDIPIDLIVGNEMGAVIGAFYSAQKSSFDLEWKVFQLKPTQLFDEIMFGKEQALMAGSGVQQFVSSQLLTKDISELKPEVIVTTTNLRNGQRVIFDQGAPSPILRAALSIPGLYPPVSYQGRDLISGGLSSGFLPIDEAIARNVDVVIVVDPMGHYSVSSFPTMKDILYQSYLLSSRALSPKQPEIPVVMIAPNLQSMSPFDADRRKEAMIAGMRATEAALPMIRSALK